MAYFISLISLICAYLLGGIHGLFIAILLGMLEVSLSFDNAIVNAIVLKTMSLKWQRRFLTWGIGIAVFGMRLIFPIIIVAIASGSGMLEVVNMAIYNTEAYKENLISSHSAVAGFGAGFLMMVFMNFLFHQEREIHWLILDKITCGKRGIIARAFICFIIGIVAGAAGIVGVGVYVIIDLFKDHFKNLGSPASIGFSSFMYLEVLDASFSLDGVIGAFAISNDLFIIMLGLGIGAAFIRSMTIKLVQNKTLDEYIYLEHGAHYGIGALAIIMLFSDHVHIPEIITGLIGVAFILGALISSINHNRRSVCQN